MSGSRADLILDHLGAERRPDPVEA